MSKEKPGKKRGRPEDFLKIEEDPGDALDRLLGVERKSEADDAEEDDANEVEDESTSQKGG